MTGVRRLATAIGWLLLVVAPVVFVGSMVIGFASGAKGPEFGRWESLLALLVAIPNLAMWMGAGAALLILVDMDRRRAAGPKD